ncbi:MAG: hypothetical protein GXZ08_02440 [Tissierellia bacterium]|nr:hypothetical protein [Tissierellia bacterium]
MIEKILNRIAEDLRIIFPDTKKVYLERIKKLETPSFSIEVVSYDPKIFDESIINTVLTLDIVYFSKDNDVITALKAGDMLKRYLGLGLKVEDRFLHSRYEPRITMIEQDLHFIFTLDFHEGYSPFIVNNINNDLINLDSGGTNIDNHIETQKYELMEDLTLETKKRSD